MKIGIMSMQRIRNYGSFLQAYGLKKTLESFGHEVIFIDYHFERALDDFNKKSLLDKVVSNLNVLNYLRKKKVQREYDNRFDKEFIPFLTKGHKCYGPENIDLLVIGSDEVFNCLQPYPVGYSRELFGKGFEEIPVISYAACFGQTNYESLAKYGISGEVSKMLKRFKKISVRDNNSFNTVKRLTGIEPVINLDPVLISDYSDEMIDNVKINNYIIVYAYPGRLTKEEKRGIKVFAKKHNKRIVSFGMFQEISDKEIVVSPFEMFPYFKHADFIITDTFHGSIFSIKTHSKFCTIVRKTSEGNSNKLEDLLNRLKLNKRIINNIQQLDGIYSTPIDYSETDKIIKRGINETMDYLSQSIK